VGSSAEFSASASRIPGIAIRGATIGGVQIEGDAVLRPMLQGDHVQLMHLKLKAGYHHPRHSHPDNESIGFVVSGQIEMTIADETHLLGPGDAWWHPKGVYHSTTAIEDSIAVELHAPRREDYLAHFLG